MKTVGIIGGMGPLATVDLFGKIVNLTDAKCDNDHIHIFSHYRKPLSGVIFS